MRINELFEQTFAPVPAGQVGATAPTTPSAGGTAAAPGMTGPGMADLNSPAVKAAQLASQNQQKAAQKKSIQDQIAALQKQLSDLQSGGSAASMMSAAPTV
jgi:hypothetical protein